MPLKAVALIFLFKDINLSPFSFTMPTLPDNLPATLKHAFFKMENSLSTLCLDKLFLQWNTAVHRMNYCVCTAGRHRATSPLGRMHAAFFTTHQMQEMIYMPDEVILVRMMVALDLGFEKAMYYHDEGHENDNGYGSPHQITRPIHIFSVFTTEASFDLAEFTTTQQQISPFTPKCPGSLSF